jgi:hypothetical protein
VRFNKSTHRLEQTAAPRQSAVAAGARQQVGALVRQASPFFVDIAFSVIEDRDPGGFGQDGFGLAAAFEPAIGFLVLDRKLLVVFGLPLGAPPDLRVRHPKTLLRIGIHGYDRMDEQACVATVSYLAKPVLAPALRLVIDLASILNRQHMPARGGSRYEHRASRDHFLGCDRVVREKAPELRLLSSAIREVAETDCLPLNHPSRHEFAVPLQSGIAKIPNLQLHRRPPAPIRDGGNRITPDSPCSNGIALQHRNRSATWPDSHCNICAQASPFRGR